MTKGSRHKEYLSFPMAESITLNILYKELKLIEQKMATKEELNRMLETLEILSNPSTMEQLRESEKEISLGKFKEIKSVRDI